MDRSQHKAVYQPVDRSTLVVAPPGYGKTYVMTKRISHLLQSGSVRPPSRILGLTFTNAAAGEMLERVRLSISSNLLDYVTIKTFHSLCYDILRAYGNHIETKRDYTVVGENQRETILLRLFQEHGVQLNENWPSSTEEVRSYKNWLKHKILRLRSDYSDPRFEAIFSKIYKEYRNELGSGSLDFMHILYCAYQLLLRYPQILEIYRAAFRYILIDEFQDTNPLQFQLLRLLAHGHPELPDKLPPRTVFILADPHQAIYEFQGATPENVERAKEVFDCQVICLEKNHRSDAESIAVLAKTLREGNVDTAIEQNDRVKLSISDDPYEEAVKVSERILSYEGSLHEICVASQSSYRLSPIQDLLSNEEIPFVFVPDFRSRNVERNYAPIFESLAELAHGEVSRGRLVTQLRKICNDFNDNWEEDEVLEILVNLAGKYDYEFGSSELKSKAREFVNDIMLEINWGDLLRRNVRDKVFLSTIHGVKGLQFDQVHVCGLVNFEHIFHDICWPCKWGRNRRDILDELKEPRRTLYVAITRSRNQLFLYATRKSDRNKQRSPICLLEPLISYLQIEGLRENEDIARLLCGS